MQCIDLRVGASEQFNLSDVDYEDQPYSTVRCIVVATNHSNIDSYCIMMMTPKTKTKEDKDEEHEGNDDKLSV